MKQLLSGYIQRPYRFLLLLIGFMSCQGYESSIPDSYVYLKRNIYTDNLSSPGSYLYVDKPRAATEGLGFGGILIVHSFDVDHVYYAFDLACPVEKNQNVRIGKPDQGLFCICDSCGEKYDLGLGLGVPLNHKSKEGLRRYTVRLDENNNIIVTR